MNQQRQPAGIPIGGQFSTAAREESTATELPVSRVTETHYAPSTVVGLKNTYLLSHKPVEPENWIEDFQQVTSGAGSVAYSAEVSADRQHACPLCGSTTSDKLVHVPNCAYYGLQYSCSCGCDYDAEDVPDPEFPSLQPLTPPVGTEQTKANFAYWWARRAPADAKPIYDDEGLFCRSIQLSDGTTVSRTG